jgi:predicted Zn-dependent peptidase
MIPKLYSAGDGIRLRVCRTEKFKASMLSVSAMLPIEGGTPWLTSLLLSVLRRGTQHYPDLASINRRLDYLYGAELGLRNFYRGDSQIIGLTADMVDPSYLPDVGESPLEDVLEVMCQILFHPLLDENGLLLEKYVESEKKLQCDHIRSIKSNPRAYAIQHCYGTMFDKEPCGTPIYGTEEQVMSATPEMLTAHWRELVKKLAFDCFYVGNTAGEEISAALQKMLGREIDSAASLPDTLCRRVVRAAKELRRREESLPVGQGQLVIGMRSGIAVGDPDFYSCMVFNELLGMSPISRLFVNVREKLSLCYHCASTYNFYKGIITITCGLENRNRERAEEEIFRQLALVAEGAFTGEELEGAKRSLENGYRQLEDSPGALESYYYGRSLAGLEDGLDTCRASMQAVTREDVIAAAKKISPDTVFFLEGTLDGGEEELDDCDVE